ncbi:MAG: class I SAM-dependent methyltransferase [Mycobacterium sp.]
MFHKIAASLKVDPTEYTFLDIGSGKGKVLFLASDLPFHRIIGIEYAEGLHEAAVRNIASYRSDKQRCHDIQSVHANALQYPMPPGPLVVLVFNALAPELMAEFLRILDQGPASEPDRPVLVVYANLRTVRELTGNPFDGLKHLRVIDRDNRVIVSGNQAGRLARERSADAKC